MSDNVAIPVLRVLDYHIAYDFYVNWLGFKVYWINQISSNAPVYAAFEKRNLKIHVSEHTGDGQPGGQVFAYIDEIEDFYFSLSRNKYRINRPGIHYTFYDCILFSVTDPFGNRIMFNEKYDEKRHAHLKLF